MSIKRLLHRTSARRRASRRAAIEAQRGITLLEILIVLAILGLVMGVLVVPNVLERFEDSKADLTFIEAKKIANEHYAEWAIKNRKGCPTLEALVEISGKKKLVDKWDQPYIIHCGETRPSKRIRFGISSAGPDGKKGTEDDIKSWEDPNDK